MAESKYWQLWIPILNREFEKEVAKAPAVSDAHQIDHVYRVLNRCEHLGATLGADMETLVAASYLHDLGRHYIRDKAHGALSSDIAKPILKRIGFPQEKHKEVLHAIRVHDVTARNKDRDSLESKILFDADKLDSFGVIGVVRNILYYYNKKTVDYILEDLDSKWKGLSLDKTREYAKKDYEYTKSFFAHLKQELSD